MKPEWSFWWDWNDTWLQWGLVTIQNAAVFALTLRKDFIAVFDHIRDYLSISTHWMVLIITYRYISSGYQQGMNLNLRGSFSIGRETRYAWELRGLCCFLINVLFWSNSKNNCLSTALEICSIHFKFSTHNFVTGTCRWRKFVNSEITSWIQTS